MNADKRKVVALKPRTRLSDPPAAEQKPVGIWLRVSTEDQARGESPETHERRARYYAESKSWLVREVYHPEAVSGKTVLEHPEAQRMLADIKSGRISALIFSKLARLARNTRELLDFSDLFQANGADLISLQEAIDTTKPAGRLFYTMIAAMAQWEREEIASRVAASIPIRAKMGKPLGGAAPFGYQWVDKQLVVDPQEAPVRKLIYELFLEHRRAKRVARLLNEMGHRTRSRALFSDTTVKRLIRDPMVKGLRRANYTRITSSNRHWELKPESDWVFTPVEPIVSEELWNQANAILAERGKTGKRPSRSVVQLLGGLTHCACGGKMNVPSNSAKYVCKLCRNKIPIGDLEAVYYEQLQHFLLSPQQIGEYLSRADEANRQKEELATALEREKDGVAAEMDKVYRLYVDDKITPEGFGDRYKPLEAQLSDLQERIPRLQAEIDFLKIQHLSRDEVLSQGQNLYERLPEMPFESRRRIVESITERITVGDGDIAIDLCYHPPLPSSASSSPGNAPPWQHEATGASGTRCGASRR